MGYASDLGTGTVHDICPVTGYPRDQWGHLLQTANLNDGAIALNWDKRGTELQNFTSPYGHLEFGIGSGDDFYCFDYEVISAGPRGRFIILHAMINCESGGFIEDAPYGYEVLPLNTMAEERTAIRKAFGMAGQAQEWCMHNDVKHSTIGWNQNTEYFPICVARALFPYKFRNQKTGQELSVRKNNAKAHKIAQGLAFGK